MYIVCPLPFHWIAIYTYNLSEYLSPCTDAQHWVDVGELKFVASNFLMSWPTAEQLASSASSEQIDPRVVYVADVTEELSELVIVHLESKRRGGGLTDDSQLMDDGTLMVKFADVEGRKHHVIICTSSAMMSEADAVFSLCVCLSVCLSVPAKTEINY